jgi:glycosyltransferase involved in cell wall biosynthesis
MSKSRIVPTELMIQLAKFTPWVPGLWEWVETTQIKYDLVGGMTIVFESLLAAGLKLARRWNIPFVSYPLTHLGSGSEPAQDKLSRFYTMEHQVDLVLKSDAIISQTRTEKEFYESKGYDPQKISVAGPGVTPDEIIGGNAQAFRERYGISAPIIIAIGAMSYEKGTVHTVEAVRQLWQAGCSVELVLIGAELNRFKNYLARLPATDRKRIRILGVIDEKEKRDALAAASVLSMPSRSDSFGIVFLEAWLYGLPVIGARTWGVNDIVVDGYDGFLVPFGDVSTLTNVLTYILDHPETAAAMGERGRQKVYDQHTWARKNKLVEEVYQNLVDLKLKS